MSNHAPSFDILIVPAHVLIHVHCESLIARRIVGDDQLERVGLQEKYQILQKHRLVVGINLVIADDSISHKSSFPCLVFAVLAQRTVHWECEIPDIITFSVSNSYCGYSN